MVGLGLLFEGSHRWTKGAKHQNKKQKSSGDGSLWKGYGRPMWGWFGATYQDVRPPLGNSPPITQTCRALVKTANHTKHAMDNAKHAPCQIPSVTRVQTIYGV